MEILFHSQFHPCIHHEEEGQDVGRWRRMIPEHEVVLLHEVNDAVNCATNEIQTRRKIQKTSPLSMICTSNTHRAATDRCNPRAI